MALLIGKKTYIVGAALVAIAGLHVLYPTLVPDSTYAWLKDILTGGAVLALRAGIAKM